MNIDISKVSQQTKDLIIKEYMLKSYHWTVGTLCFTIGVFLGILIS